MACGILNRAKNVLINNKFKYTEIVNNNATNSSVMWSSLIWYKGERTTCVLQLQDPIKLIIIWLIWG